MKKIYVLGGGTFNHVRSHLSLATPAFGAAAHTMKVNLDQVIQSKGWQNEFEVILKLTKMADPQGSELVTNDDVATYLDQLIADPDTKGIVFNVALTDYRGSIGDVVSGKYATRMETSKGESMMQLTPSDKLIGRIRKVRKDIFAVGFKTTSDATSDVQYVKGLKLLKTNSLNLVLSNDLVTRNNMIIAPEETRYHETTDRADVLRHLATIMMSRITNTFTRSTVIPGEAVEWNGNTVPDSLRTVVNHCIKGGAYKPFLGKTAGHFAVRVGDDDFLTSIRKSNFNSLDQVGLVRIQSKNDNEVIAHGFRPSVGGQSQRIIFREHPDLDCIVHFHCPTKEGVELPTVPQWRNECGSHQCGQATSGGLQHVDLGDGDSLKVVYLDAHGPNVVFNRKTNPQKVIDFIERSFDLRAKTGGMVDRATMQ
jgi:hypothetical protein